MIRRFLLASIVGCCCFGVMADAADLPLSLLLKPPRAPAVEGRKAAKQHLKSTHVSKPDRTAKLSAETSLAEAPAASADSDQAPSSRIPPPADSSQEMELSWFLGALSANADGPKNEASASMQGNLVIAGPGYVTSPYMVIEVSGHIVKTADTTVRLDVKVGSVHRTVNWKAGDVESGRFSISLDAPMAEGELPGYFPASALLFVTREKPQGVAMLALEKIRVRVGKIAQVASQ